jgi:DNA (cytosine-5)-methyltransferase 1
VTVTALDLFAGAGGLSAGLSAAGATVALAVEEKEAAAATYELNHVGVEVVNKTITRRWRAKLGDTPDLVAGGPPCQGWSTLGHRGAPKRRARHNAALALFLQQVEILRPRAVLLENVRGLAMAQRGRKLASIEREIRALGYDVKSALVRASDYGVPQLRHRLFVVGVRRDEGFEYAFPEPSPAAPSTFADAVGDLPPLEPGGSSSAYAGPPLNEFQRRLRGDESILTLHRAPSHPQHILDLLDALPMEGGSVQDLPSRLRPTSGFHNTYARLRSDVPAPAVTSSIGRISSGRHVHPTQNRALTVREAARLQTFADSYRWAGGRWAIYEQVGNAVPPLLAQQIAMPLIKGLLATSSRRAGRSTARNPAKP